jgi:hypothetical protein
MLVCGVTIIRSIRGRDIFLRGLGSRQVGMKVPNMLGRPLLFLSVSRPRFRRIVFGISLTFFKRRFPGTWPVGS